MRQLKLLPSGALLVTHTLAVTVPAFASPPTAGGQPMPHPSPTCPSTTTLAAKTLFHIQHGWAAPWPKGTTPEQKQGFSSPGTNFTLFMDGKQAPHPMCRQPDRSAGVTDKWLLANFPNGMTGTRTFLGEWYNDTTLALTCEIEVTFTYSAASGPWERPRRAVAQSAGGRPPTRQALCHSDFEFNGRCDL